MVEVDPVVLLAVGTAVIGAALAIVLCGKPSSEVVHTKVETVPTKSSKKKKASKSEAKKTAAAATVEPKKTAKSSPTKTKQFKAPVEPPVFEESPSQVDSSEPVEDVNDDLLAVAIKKTADSTKPKKAKETSEQKAQRLERQRIARAAKEAEEAAEQAAAESALAAEIEIREESALSFSPPAFDGWAVVEDKRKVKSGKQEKESSSPAVETTTPVIASVTLSAPAEASSAAPEPTAPPAPVVDSITVEVPVEARKVGVLIGPKGTTRIALSAATSTEIMMPKADRDTNAPTMVTITGPAQGVKLATKAINDLCTKGYSMVIAPEDFKEEFVPVHPMYLADIIGKGGATIKALQQESGVRINTPNTPKVAAIPGEPVTKVKIGIAGQRDKVVQTRNLIKELIKYYHTPITHPGIEHIEMDVAPAMYSYIIGSKGSEIKHIQNSYKVSVYIPNADTINQSVLIVGLPENIANAESHILKLLEKVEAQRAAAEEARNQGLAAKNRANQQAAASANSAPATTSVGPSMTSAVPARRDEPDEDERNPENAWMQQFAPPSMGMDLSTMLPPGFESRGPKGAAAATASASVVAAVPPTDSTAAAPTPNGSTTEDISSQASATATAPSAWNKKTW